MPTDLAILAQQISEETGHYGGGPMPDFEKAGRHTFLTLIAAGLLPSHRFLDFGCGSLRNGYWLMRFLDSGNYYGMEPVEKGVRAGLKHLIGPELEAFKKPTFLFDESSDISAFGVSFDYVMARSVVSHTCPGMLHKMLRTFAESSPGGAMYASYWRHDLPDFDALPKSEQPLPPEIERYRGMAVNPNSLKPGRKFAVGDDLADDDMRFIAIITYSLSKIQEMAAQHGLAAEEDWTFKPMNKQIWLKFTKKDGVA